MAGRKTRRAPNDLKAIQDERLTCRHIQALMQLQQITDENDELKCKLQTLEKEVSACQELHRVARDAKRTLEKLDQDWRMTMEKNLSELRANHKKKMMQVLENDEKAKISEQKGLDKLQMRIQQLELKNDNLKKSEEQNNSDKKTIRELETKLDESASKLADAEALATKLGHELQEKKANCHQYESERKENKALIDDLASKLKNMSLKLSSEVEAKRKLVEQSDLVKELEKQRCMIEALEEENSTYESNIDELRSELDENGKKIRDLEKENMIIMLERDALQQSSMDLRKEVEYLKEKEAAGRSSSCSDFNEYVNVKRELISLKEENSKLKSSASKIEFRTLRSDVPKPRRLSSKSLSTARKI